MRQLLRILNCHKSHLGLPCLSFNVNFSKFFTMQEYVASLKKGSTYRSDLMTSIRKQLIKFLKKLEQSGAAHLV